ncbi:MAG: chorismate synthase, partial [Clostridia bacterium]|nr:chorismate synthase [Clostridia bacterium]
KPTPSIALPQRSVDMESMADTILSISGRHDACIVPRAVPCVEAACALAILDAVLLRRSEVYGH